MASLILPLEIINLIFNQISDSGDHDDLLSCRLVCKTFKSLVTPHAFRTLILSEDNESRTAFFNIVGNPQLAELVKTIYFTYEDGVTDDNDQYGDHRHDDKAFSQDFHV